ncbi:hypothetical protein [Halorubrum halodurans]|uniref:hypothetical protein n=1 Tax=Halorubrum halodurans TaxID=1383851 RepID=UPI0011798C14|nr:hypothetical protein [Halorubrum halodurans]
MNECLIVFVVEPPSVADRRRSGLGTQKVRRPNEAIEPNRVIAGGSRSKIRFVAHFGVHFISERLDLLDQKLVRNLRVVVKTVSGPKF